MKLLTSGNMGALIPTEEDFLAFKKAGHTDAMSRQELLDRYKGYPVALIEVSMNELTDKLNHYRPQLEKMYGSCESEINGEKGIKNVVRATLASLILAEMSSGKSHIDIANAK